MKEYLLVTAEEVSNTYIGSLVGTHFGSGVVEALTEEFSRGWGSFPDLEYLNEHSLTLAELFTWADSPQGHDYWSNIHAALESSYKFE